MGFVDRRYPLEERGLLFRNLGRATLRTLAFLLVPVLAGWFLYVVADSAPVVRPHAIRFPTPERYDPYLDDFVVFQTAGKMTLEGNGAKLYELEAIHSAEAEALGQDKRQILVLPFFNPPPVALLLMPFGALPLPIGAIVWTGTGLLLLAATMGAMFRHMGVPIRSRAVALWSLGMVASWPFMAVLLHGQMTFLTMAGWFAIWLGAFAGRGRSWAVLGLLILAIKPQFLPVPLVFLAFSREWRTLAVWGAAEFLFALVALPWTGIHAATNYPLFLLEASRWVDTNGIDVGGMLGWNAFTSVSVFGGSHHSLAHATALVLSAVTVLLATRQAGKKDAGAFASVVFASLLASPHLYAHDALLTVAPLTLLAFGGGKLMRATWTLFALALWFAAHIHVDVQWATSINLMALMLGVGFGLAFLPPAWFDDREKRAAMAANRQRVFQLQ